MRHTWFKLASPRRLGTLRVFMLCICAAVILTIAGAPAGVAHASYDDWRIDPGRRWTVGFELEPGVTYTYKLRLEPDKPDKGWGPGGRDGRRLEGELNLWRPHGSDEIRFWYALDESHGSGSAPAHPLALAEAVLLSALTGPDPLSHEALRLLATPFYLLRWYDMLTSSEFRDGVVWEVYQHPPLRFTAREHGRSRTYTGTVSYGRDEVLEVQIDLSRPLPLKVIAAYDRDRYVAELVDSPGRGPLR